MSSTYVDAVPLESDYESDYEAWGDPEAWEPEAPRRGGGRRAPARPPRSYTQPQQTGQYVTQKQLQDALAGVRSDMEKNAAAIRSVGSQVDALGTRTRREIAGIRNEMRNTAQMLAIIPLLTQGQSATVAKSGTLGTQILPAGTQVATASEGISAILPFLLIGGIGSGSQNGTSGSSSGMFGGDNSLLLVLALTLMNRPQQPAQVPAAP
jgi:biotin operon repressor